MEFKSGCHLQCSFFLSCAGMVEVVYLSLQNQFMEHDGPATIGLNLRSLVFGMLCFYSYFFTA